MHHNVSVNYLSFRQLTSWPYIVSSLPIVVNNVKSRVDQFVSEMQSQATHYRSNHVLALMGDDFTYKTFSTWYYNMDKLIHYVNQDGRVNVFYSTPSMYVKVRTDHCDIALEPISVLYE